MEVPQETLAETGEEPAPQRQGGVAEKMNDQPLQPQGGVAEMNDPLLQPQGGVAEKTNNPPLQPQGGVAEKTNDSPLQPVPLPRDTNSHPQQQGGGAVGAGHMVIRPEAGEEQPLYHSPSLKDEETLQTSVEESEMPSLTTSQMVVKETALVKKEWYQENSELVVPTTK